MWGRKKEKEPMGYLGDMNDRQQECLKQLHQHITDNNLYLSPWFDDMYLLRFCRARKFDVKKVIVMFEAFLKFRKENELDTIM